jgi:DNA-binding winged helix-turn-helix (wHTH) protein/Tol biopolymer transport system component
MPDRALGFQIIPPPRRIRFGPFEIDSRTGELRKHGIKVRLGQQTFQILLMLLENPGEVVLREEIRLKLWPNDTVVEFDHSINAAIQKLREALGDAAGNPRYIETLPRRGYRFVGTVDRAPVSPAGERVAPAVPQASESVPAPSAEAPLIEAPSPEIPAEAIRAWRSWLAVALAATLFFALIALAIPRSKEAPAPVANWTFSLGPVGEAVVSPDGSAVLHRVANGLMLRRMDSVEEIPVYRFGRVTDAPAWSPDGSQLLFSTLTGFTRITLPNGPPAAFQFRTGPTRGFAWSPNGTVLVAMFSGRPDGGDLYRIPSDWREPSRLDIPQLKEGMFFYPEFLPDGKNILFAWAGYGEVDAGLYLATLENGKISRGPVLLRKNMTAGHYSPSNGGMLLYVQNDTLYAQKLNIPGGMLEGRAQRILDGVFSEPTVHRAQFSVSRNGVLTWRSGHAALAQLTWFDRTGKVLELAGPPCLPTPVRLSPDERHVVFETTVNNAGFSIAEADRSGFVPVSGLSAAPLWMPDSSRILFSRQEGNGARLMVRAAAGGPEKALVYVPELGPLIDVSPDGNVALYHAGLNLNAIRLDDPRATPKTLAQAVQARFSPDGRWVVYSTTIGSGDEVQVFAQPFPSGGLPLQLTSNKGTSPVWRGDGKEILYRVGSKIYSLEVQIKGNTLQASNPEALFDVRLPGGLVGDSAPMAVTRDGSKILFAQGIDDPGSHDTYVMSAWDKTLGR